MAIQCPEPAAEPAATAPQAGTITSAAQAGPVTATPPATPLPVPELQDALARKVPHRPPVDPAHVLVVAVDTRPLMRSGLAAVARRAFGHGAIPLPDLDQAISATRAAGWAPHVLLVGLQPGDDPAALTRRAREVAPLVLLALDSTDPDLVRAAIRARADGLLAIEHTSPEALVAAVDAAEFGEPSIPAIFSELREARISARGRQILTALAAGLQDDEIGVQLGISTSSVRKHLAVTQARLGARTRTQAVAIAIQERLI